MTDIKENTASSIINSESPTDPIIRARGLVKIYKTKAVRLKALNGIDLDIMPNEFLAIVGTSGSGKSTLLSLLAGLEKPSAGKIAIKGHGIHRMNENQLVSFRLKHTGFIFQSFNLMETLTAAENVAFPLMAQGVGKDEREKAAADMLKKMGLGEHLMHKPGELSGGQQQRVSIARAIITQPDIVFADEPTGNLDTHTADDIINILSSISKENETTVLMVTHDAVRAQAADRIVHIEDGKIIKTEEKAQ